MLPQSATESELIRYSDMLILNCPNCGQRNVCEFRNGGEYRPRPARPREAGDQQWSNYVFFRNNVSGVQKEWWYHRNGCGLWFLAERHTKTNEIVSTFRWGIDRKE